MLSNANTTTNNTVGINFGFVDTSLSENVVSASIVAINGARTAGQFSTGQLAFLTSPAGNLAPQKECA